MMSQSEYVAMQLDKLQVLATQMESPKGHPFIVKISSPFGSTHNMAISYEKYFRIAQILLEGDD